MSHEGKGRSRIAYGTINPMRFVQAQPGVINGIIQCSGPGVPIEGIAWESIIAMPGTQTQTTLVPQNYPAAASGSFMRLYEMGGMETMLIVGSGQTIYPNQFITSDASGNGVGLDIGATTSGTKWIGAKAIEGGDAGNPIRVEVYTVPYTKP